MVSKARTSYAALTCAMVMCVLLGCKSPCKREFQMTALSYFPKKSAICPPLPTPHFANPHFYGYHGTCWFRWPEEWKDCPCEVDVLEERYPMQMQQIYEVPAPPPQSNSVPPDSQRSAPPAPALEAPAPAPMPTPTPPPAPSPDEQSRRTRRGYRFDGGVDSETILPNETLEFLVEPAPLPARELGN
jgi:hypothetical protein